MKKIPKKQTIYNIISSASHTVETTDKSVLPLCKLFDGLDIAHIGNHSKPSTLNYSAVKLFSKYSNLRTDGRTTYWVISDTWTSHNSNRSALPSIIAAYAY